MYVIKFSLAVLSIRLVVRFSKEFIISQVIFFDFIFYVSFIQLSHYCFPVLTRKNFLLGRQCYPLLFYQFSSIHRGMFLEIPDALSFLPYRIP
jgi:hypothetical protein